MCTLLLRLSAPLQSWGTEVRFDTCTTRREPTKSGVLGMIAAAMGCSREEFPERLNTLKFGVRVDREGKQLRDFQTAHHPEEKTRAYITNRSYLSDAIFLVALEGDPVLLDEIAYALRHPYYPLYLGRRSCPPTGRLIWGLRELPLEEALRREPLTDPHPRRGLDGRPESERVRIVLDAPDGSGADQRDVILSLSLEKRLYGYRGVKEILVPLQDKTPPPHDPLAELEDSVCT